MSATEKANVGNMPDLPPSGVGLSSASGNPSRQKSGRFGKRDYNPTPWSYYWDECKDVDINGDIFRVYKKGSSGPVLFMLHGGGYSALTWSLFAAAVYNLVECQILAFDQRGHGDTWTSNDQDLSAATLAKDTSAVLDVVYGDDRPPCVLVGHSMGGAIAVHASYENYISVIDVVEGTALDALSSMQNILRGRPQTFNSLQHAIEWSVRSGQTRNAESAKISMPGQIKNVATGKCGTSDVDEVLAVVSTHAGQVLARSDTIPEEDNGVDESSEDGVSHDNQQICHSKYTWRINLAKTELYWAGWFHGLSLKFLGSPPAKMLLLAGIDRLDTNLTVGQMQGKFQMQVLPQCGHAVHEDVPDRVAEVLATFLIRYKLTQSKSTFLRSFPAC